MKRILIILCVLILALVAYFIFQKDQPAEPTESPLSTFKWRFEKGDLNQDGIPGTQIFLDATYGDKILAKQVDEVGSSCNEIAPSDEDQDILVNTSKIQCYGAGLGDWFKITAGENSYMVKRKSFEEALPDQKPVDSQYEIIAEFPLVY